MNMRLLRFSLDILRKEVARKMASSYLPAPYFVVFSVTHRCNARCVMCDHWQSRDASGEISIQTWKDALLGLRRWAGPSYLVLTGGEPFVKEGFFELLGFASLLGFYTDVATNGLALNKETADRLMNAGADVLQFSLYSQDPELHDLYKGVKGLHEHTTGIIRYIKARSRRTKVSVLCIISKDNYRSLSDFIVWATDVLGVDYINFQPLSYDPAYRLHGTQAMPVPPWSREDLDALDQELERVVVLRRKGYPINASFEALKNFEKHFRNTQGPARRGHCDIGMRNLVVSPSGEVYLCQKFPPIGSLKEAALEKIWHSQEAANRRRQISACDKVCLSGCFRGYTFSEKVFNFLIKAEPRALKMYRKLNRVFGS